MTKNSKCFGTGDETRVGVYRLNNYTNYIKNNDWWFLPGETQYRNDGTYTWVCPPGVKKVHVVCIGGGAGSGQSWANDAGSSGGLGWKNNIPVAEGNSYTVVVGYKGWRSSNQRGGKSYFISESTVCGGGGGSRVQGQPTDYQPNGDNDGGQVYGGGWSGDGGGQGRAGTDWSDTCGAGGYQGRGGKGNQNGSGGGGGGGHAYSSTHGVGSGGGVGWWGQGPDGRTSMIIGSYQQDRGKWDGEWSPGHNGLGGQGGSKATGSYSGYQCGYNGSCGENPWGFSRMGNQGTAGWPGGGGAGPGTSQGGGDGSMGAVRILWDGEMYGTGRSFPNTNTQELNPSQGYTINVGS